MPASATFWDRIAESYAAKPVDNPEAFDRKIAITRDRIEPHHAVLDIGCGTGSLLLRLADTAASFHGLDISSEMVRIARDKAATAAASNVTFHVGPFDDTFDVFADGSLDGVCAYSLLHLVDDLDDAVKRIHRLLKPGGFFVASTVCLGDSWFPYRPMLAVMRALGKAPYVRILPVAELNRSFRDAGFVDIERPNVGASATTVFTVTRKPR